jgi:hypothetical protein
MNINNLRASIPSNRRSWVSAYGLRSGGRPEIPLHTNGSENHIRCQLSERKISGASRSDAGHHGRDARLSLMKTSGKLSVPFWDYLGNRLAVPEAPSVPLLPDLVRQRAAPP